MVSEKIVRFQNKNLNQSAQQIVTMPEGDGYKIQMTSSSPVGTIIQAKKAGILSDIITVDRVFTILISGDPNNFAINIGIGKWIQNIAVAAAETLLSALFLAVDIPEMLWTVHVENEILKKITKMVA